jgi:DNA-binding NarL/FixJ family response regulator
VSGQAADGLGAVQEAARTRPDVVLMDIRMPGIDGLEATGRIAAHPDLADTRVLVLTTFERDEFVFEALRRGASGFLLKDTPPARLLDAIRTVSDGGALLAPSVTRTLIREITEVSRRTIEPHPHVDLLTEREREVVTLVAQGMSNHEIAEALVLSPATSRTHVSRAMTKLEARDRAQLVVFAYQSGLA